MRRLFLFFIILLTNAFCFSQSISGHYGQCEQLIYKPGDFEVDLFLFDKGSYVLLLTDQPSTDADDFVYVIVLSNGSFIKDSNNLYLTDDIEKYTMSFNIIDNGNIVAERTFGFLKNRTFCFINTPEMLGVRDYFKDSDNYFTETECERYNEKHRQTIPMKYGFYGDKYESNLSYNYRINNDTTFVISYQKTVISEGMWQRDNNVLILTDKDLQFSSYLLIDEDCLLTKNKSKYIKIQYVSDSNQ